MSSISVSVDLFRDIKSLILQFAKDHATFSIGAILGTVVLYAVRYLASPYRKLPPGPRGYPIIGILLELREAQRLKFTEWRKKYGDIFYLNAAGQPIVILNSRKVCVDLLERRAAIYSDRPANVLVCDLMCNGLLFAFARYEDKWRRMRKAANEKLNEGSARVFYEAQMTEVVVLACNWLVDSNQWDQHSRRCTASTMQSVPYGHASRILYMNSIRLSCAAYPGAHLVEFFPWMRHIPSSWLKGLAKWKRDAETSYKQDTAAKGDDDQSVGTTSIRERRRGTSSLRLNELVGRARLPTFADYPHLPPIGPLGVPRKFIPKSTICIPNMWRMNRDPEVYAGENAAHFDPARHLDATEDAASDLAAPASRKTDMFHTVLGVGRHVSDNSIFINIAVLLYWASSKMSVRKTFPAGFFPWT
ncbi:cytochrome P450 [Russula emetica]|nr:cytochrome P450 [Russula emetica]